MNNYDLPFNEVDIKRWANEHPTPFYIYDEQAIINNAKELYEAFSWADYKNYYAVKACPNPHILEILRDCGMGADCSSLPELLLAQQSGISGEGIMFTSNNTPTNEFIEANNMGAVINLDDITQIDIMHAAIGMPDLICFRYNPGELKIGNSIIGSPEESKYGLTRDQLFEAYAKCKKLGATRFGLHTMVASNERNPKYFIETARILFELVAEIKSKLDISIEFVNLGGGIGIPYLPNEDKVDLTVVSQGVKNEYEKYIEGNGLAPLKICMENGRMITGPYGYLVTQAINKKNTFKNFIGVDACMANLMRPGMYEAYHHLTVLGKEELPKDKIYDVCGSLCENNDKFAVNRELPEIVNGDFIVIHDAGAHGHAMGFNYNGKLKSAEFILPSASKDLKMIRRAETIEDYFSTLNF